MTNAAKPVGTNRMPVHKGKVGEHEVEVLRDTGCSGIVVKSKFVRKDQYTGNFCQIIMINKTIIRAPTAIIYIDTPFLREEVTAVVLPDAAYDLCIGNVTGAREPNNPEIYEEGNVTSIRMEKNLLDNIGKSELTKL